MTRLGTTGTLRGLPTTASVEHGVGISGEYGEVVAFRSMATIPASDAPKQGDVLIVDGISYTIDALEANNGYTVRCVLR